MDATLSWVKGADAPPLLQTTIGQALDAAALRWGALTLPLGFLLGGLVIHDGDPGIGVVLVPIGAVMLLYGVGSAARTLGKIK